MTDADQKPGPVPALGELSPAERHRRVAAGFAERVRGVVVPAAWDAPAPVEGWTARDVVRHLVEWLPGLLGRPVTGGAPSVDTDPVAAWQTHADGVQAILDAPETASEQLANPHVGELSVADAIDRFYTADVFMHTWDLARATGQDETLDAGFCAQLLAGMAPMEDMMRGSGQFGARVPVPTDADVQTRLLGFIGRHP